MVSICTNFKSAPFINGYANCQLIGYGTPPNFIHMMQGTQSTSIYDVLNTFGGLAKLLNTYRKPDHETSSKEIPSHSSSVGSAHGLKINLNEINNK